MRAPVLAVLVSLGLIATGCGGGGDDDDAGDGTTTTTTTAAPGDSTGAGETTTTTVAGSDGSATTATTAPGDTTATTAPGPSDPGGDPGGALDASGPAPDMTGEEICAAVPADVAGAALGVTGVVASAGTTGTPQCSYQFDLPSGQSTDATIAALRNHDDLADRFGDEAFDFVVSVNKAAAQDSVTETPLSIGNHAVLLTGARLHMAIVQLGGRIVTVLLNVDAGGPEVVTALAGKTVALAP